MTRTHDLLEHCPKGKLRILRLAEFRIKKDYPKIVLLELVM